MYITYKHFIVNVFIKIKNRVKKVANFCNFFVFSFTNNKIFSYL